MVLNRDRVFDGIIVDMKLLVAKLNSLKEEYPELRSSVEYILRHQNYTLELMERLKDKLEEAKLRGVV